MEVKTIKINKELTQFKDTLLKLSKCTGHRMVQQYKEELSELIKGFYESLIPVGFAFSRKDNRRFELTYNADKMEVYLEREITSDTDLRIGFFLLNELQLIFRHHFELWNLQISQKRFVIRFYDR